MARGSDGLAETTERDAGRVLIPLLTQSQRDQLRPYVENLRIGVPDLRTKVSAMLELGQLNFPEVVKRPSHVVLV